MQDAADLLSDAVKEDLWREALLDAGLSPDGFHRFDTGPGEHGGVLAQYVPPGKVFSADPLSSGPRVTLNPKDERRADDWRHDGVLCRHRVAIAPIRDLQGDIAEAAFIGLARHELEHARQWNVCGNTPFNMRDLAVNYVAPAAEGFNPAVDLPMELDANAAAFNFLHRTRRESIKPLADHKLYCLLVRTRTDPEPLDTLTSRMREFLLPHRAIIEGCAERTCGQTLNTFLEAFDLTAAALGWEGDRPGG